MRRDPGMNKKHSIIVLFLIMIIFVPACITTLETPSVPQDKSTQTLAPISQTNTPKEMIMKTSKPTTGNADVTQVRAVQQPDGSWTFYVTVFHPDTGWEDYADGWDAVVPNGKIINPDPNTPFTRLLLHPHVNEQPFTRSQSGIEIPEDVTKVIVRAHDLVDGYGGEVIEVDLTKNSGSGFEVERR
jgi:hypothetical protein